MHRRHAAKGLQVISVSLDPVDGTAAEKKQTVETVTGFLRAQGARFTNLLLAERVETDKKFHFFAPPAYFVFDKRGKWHLFLGDEAPVDYVAMEKLVVDLLQEK
jgi:hypothetical protein